MVDCQQLQWARSSSAKRKV